MLIFCPGFIPSSLLKKIERETWRESGVSLIATVTRLMERLLDYRWAVFGMLYSKKFHCLKTSCQYFHAKNILSKNVNMNKTKHQVPRSLAMMEIKHKCSYLHFLTLRELLHIVTLCLYIETKDWCMCSRKSHRATYLCRILVWRSHLWIFYFTVESLYVRNKGSRFAFSIINLYLLESSPLGEKKWSSCLKFENYIALLRLNHVIFLNG